MLDAADAAETLGLVLVALCVPLGLTGLVLAWRTRGDEDRRVLSLAAAALALVAVAIALTGLLTLAIIWAFGGFE